MNSENIEKYLLNRLSESEKVAFQFELMQNPKLRKEVQAMRQLQKVAVAEGRKPNVPTSTGFNKKWLWSLLLILPFIGFYLWNQSLQTPVKENTIPTEMPTPIDPEVQPIPLKEKDEQKEERKEKKKPIKKNIDANKKQKTTKEPQKKPTPKKKEPMPIAAADPIDLVPNPLFEQMMTGVRGNDFDVKVNAPAENAKIIWKKEGSNLSFSGVIETEETEIPTLNLLLFSNKKTDFEEWKFIKMEEIKTEQSTSGFDFSTNLKLNSKKGLYYYLIENSDTEMPVSVGKFFLE